MRKRSYVLVELPTSHRPGNDTKELWTEERGMGRTQRPQPTHDNAVTTGYCRCCFPFSSLTDCCDPAYLRGVGACVPVYPSHHKAPHSAQTLTRTEDVMKNHGGQCTQVPALVTDIHTSNVPAPHNPAVNNHLSST